MDRYIVTLAQWKERSAVIRERIHPGRTETARLVSGAVLAAFGIGFLIGRTSLSTLGRLAAALVLLALGGWLAIGEVLRRRNAMRAFWAASAVTEATALDRHREEHRDEYGGISYTYSVIFWFDTGEEIVRLRMRVGEATYDAMGKGMTLPIRHSRADPRIALLGNEIDAYPSRSSGQVVEWEPKRMDAAAYYRRGHAYLNLGKDEKALADLGRALDLDARFVKAYYYRGIAHKRVGRTRAGTADMERFLELMDDPQWRRAAEHQLLEWRDE
jgi:tetratricopeptide (TPR) repeat protein